MWDVLFFFYTHTGFERKKIQIIDMVSTVKDFSRRSEGFPKLIALLKNIYHYCTLQTSYKTTFRDVITHLSVCSLSLFSHRLQRKEEQLKAT